MTFRIRKLLPLVAILAGLLAVPAVAQAAQHITWKTDNRLEPVADDGFSGVSCASRRQCVAVDVSGRVFYTTNPYGQAKSWKSASVDKKDGGQFTGISCPSTKLCVAVDANGLMLHSTDPTGGAKKWSRPARIDGAKLAGGGYAGLAAIDCPSTRLCVAVDNSTSGGVLVSTDPAGATSTWHRVTLGKDVVLDTVSCPSTGFCVVGGSREFYSVNPAGGAGTWNAGGVVRGGFIESLWCASNKICAGAGFNADDQGIVLATAKATGGASSWKRTNVEPEIPGPTEGMFDAIACANPGFCMALDSDDNAYFSNHAAQNRWNHNPFPIRKGAVATRSVVTCTGKMCVAMDSRGVEETGTVSG